MSQDNATHPGTRRSPQELFRELWSQALVTVGGAEEEVRKVLDRAAEVADLHPEDLQRFGRELAERLKVQRKDLEQTIEDGVKSSVGRLRLPTSEDVIALRARVEKLAERVNRLERRRQPKAKTKGKV